MSTTNERTTIKINNLSNNSVDYEIKHKTILAPQVIRNKRPLFVLGQKEVRVEEFVTRILQRSGYRVFRGEDVHLFISFISLNFLDTFFLQVFHNYVGATAQSYIDRLTYFCDNLETNNQISDDHILAGEAAILAYYSSYLRKKQVYENLGGHIMQMDRDFLYRLIRMYRNMGYTTKGAPDLVAFDKTNPWFIEVKSQTDSLSAEQYKYFEDFLTSVGKNILVLRVLPEISITDT